MSAPPRHTPSDTHAHAHLLVMAAEGAALVEAARVGLLDLVAGSDTPVVDPAAALDLHPEATARILAVLQAAGLVRLQDGGWLPTPLLREAHLHGIGPLNALAKVFGSVDGFLDTGRTAPAFGERSHSSEIVADLGRRSIHAAQDLARTLGPVRGDILDLGAGSAVWSLAMALQDDHARVVAVDRPSVLPAAQALADELGLAERLDRLPGELGEVGLPAGGFQRIVLANVLHLFDDATCTQLLRWAAPALRPGGQLVIVDVTQAASETGRRVLAAYALHLRLRHEGGAVRSADALAALASDAPLQPSRVIAVDGGLEGVTAVVLTRT